MARLAPAEPVLQAAERWRDDCLLDEGSIFTDEALWTRRNAEALEKHFSHNLDTGEGDFFQKFEAQLADAPPSAVRLAAEMLWAMYLIVHRRASSGSTKRLQLRKVFGWSGGEIPDEHWALGEVLDEGVSHPGMAYNQLRWKELVFFIDFLLTWTQLSGEVRSSLLADPWAFSERLEEIPGAGNRQLPHILCFLLFPDVFERIASGSHKKLIVEAFADQVAELDTGLYADRTGLDQALLKVREALAPQYGGDLDFYSDELSPAWRPPKRPGDAGARVPDPSWVTKRFGDQRVWVLAAGRGGRMWPDFLHEGIAAIGWDGLGDLDRFASRDDVAAAITNEYGNPNPRNDSLAVWEFGHVMRPGDVILARKGADHLVAHGVVRGDYNFDEDRSEYLHTRAVDWTPVDGWRLPAGNRPPIKTLTDLTSHASWLRDAYSILEDDKPIALPSGDCPPFTIDHALEDLFLTKEHLQDILDALAQRKNLILQGPPGVGKTFIARRVAWALIGCRAPANVEFVQFHQSYAYEDFIQGFRPTEGGGFELRDGVFHRFCRKAADSDEPHVFIIDEINRGNLSRIFGELMMLIEADKRGPDHAIPLTYAQGDERFFVPDNVHVLGMMNTADRSLAMVDYALRRRFAFFNLRPAYGSERFVDYLVNAGVEEAVVRSIDERLRRLNQSIRGDAQNLGPGFEVGHSYFVPSGEEASLDDHWYRGIVRNQILPLLREYWFDRSELVDQHSRELGLT